MKKTLAIAILGLFAQSAFAGSYTLQGGTLDSTSRISIGYTADPIYTLGNLQILPVYELAHLHADYPDNKNLWQVSAVPMFRYNISKFYLEAGIGVSLFNHTRFAEKQISTAFQFSDHLGFGYHVTDNVSIGYRFSHFSNAHIKEPNPGINAQAIVLGVRF